MAIYEGKWETEGDFVKYVMKYQAKYSLEAILIVEYFSKTQTR